MRRKKHQIIKKDLYVKTTNVDLQIESLKFPNGFIGNYGSINHPNSSMAIPITDQGRILILKQYRFCLDKYIYEFPSGKIEKDEDALFCMIRELKEEAGIFASNLNYIGQIYAAPSYSNELINLFIAKDLKEVYKEKDPDEYIEVIDISIKKAELLIEKGEIMDSASIAIFKKAKKFLN